MVPCMHAGTCFTFCSHRLASEAGNSWCVLSSDFPRNSRFFFAPRPENLRASVSKGLEKNLGDLQAARQVVEA